MIETWKGVNFSDWSSLVLCNQIEGKEWHSVEEIVRVVIIPCCINVK
jgi:hypothetical protein